MLLGSLHALTAPPCDYVIIETSFYKVCFLAKLHKLTNYRKLSKKYVMEVMECVFLAIVITSPEDFSSNTRGSFPIVTFF